MRHRAEHWRTATSQSAKYLVPGYKEPTHGMTLGRDHDVVSRIHPTKSWWSNLWCNECRRFIKYKTRHAYCRCCKKWMLGIQ